MSSDKALPQPGQIVIRRPTPHSDELVAFDIQTVAGISFARFGPVTLVVIPDEGLAGFVFKREVENRTGSVPL
jgi:hypothetical protein